MKYLLFLLLISSCLPTVEVKEEDDREAAPARPAVDSAHIDSTHIIH
ncbi:hypothetical protein [Paraflavitalea pollutisoli]|nr:hypothetical protein [Paraflavitalea sp. H1-2-19X]